MTSQALPIPRTSLPMRVVAAILVASMTLASCQSMDTAPNGQPLTPAEQRLRAQSADFNMTIVEGAGVGAVLGALLGALATASCDKRRDRDCDKNMGQNIAIGAAAGGALGAGAGYYVAKQKENYFNEQERIASMTDDVKRDNQKTEALIATAKEVIATDKQRLATANDQLQKKQITLSQARSEVQRVRDNQAKVADAIKGLKKKRDDYQEAARGERGKGDTTAMDTQIKTLNSQIATLESELNSLNQALSVSRVG